MRRVRCNGWFGVTSQPREIVRVKDRNGKLAWPEPHEYLIGKRRFRSDLVPASLLVDRYFAAERDAMGELLNPTKVLAHRPGILRAATRAGSIDASGPPTAARILVYMRPFLGSSPTFPADWRDQRRCQPNRHPRAE